MKKTDMIIAHDELKPVFCPTIGKYLKQEYLTDSEILVMIRHLKYLEKYLPDGKTVKLIREKLKLEG